MTLDIFLPCRASSKRIKNKNIKKFSNNKFGLLEIKIKDLLRVKYVRNIILSTDDIKIINYIESLNLKKIKIDKRNKKLCSDNAKTDDLIKYVPKITDAEYILWTHVTSPFFNYKDYNKAIELFFKNKANYDSLMGVTKLQEFIYNETRPINFDKKKEKWPRTQTLKKFFSVNSSIFINSKKNYLKFNDRIGAKPFYFESDKVKAFDIDWPDDFKVAENIYQSFYKKKY
jgi:CMP-N-acetylneuraminic acid synthetase